MAKLTEQQLKNFDICVTALEGAKTCEHAREDEGCRFSMMQFAHDCGTPSCVLGWVGSRTDLQSDFILAPDIDARARGECSTAPVLQWADTGEYVDGHDTERFKAHFGITWREAHLLFGPSGCDNAKTPQQAIDYIKSFVAKRMAE